MVDFLFLMFFNNVKVFAWMDYASLTVTFMLMRVISGFLFLDLFSDSLFFLYFIYYELFGKLSDCFSSN